MNEVNKLDLQNWINKTSERSDLEIVFETALFVIIEALGLVGNVLVVIAVYRNKTLRSITHQYIVTLAIADFVVALIFFPMSITSSATGRWVYGPEVCWFQGVTILSWGSFTMSIVSLTAINRFVCVVKPNVYRTWFTTRKTLIVIAVTLTVCCTLVISISVAFSAAYQFGPHLFCIPIFPTKKLQMSVMLTAFFFFIFIPMATMFICYCKIYQRVKEHTQRVAPTLGRSKTGNSRQGSEDARITKSVFIVLVLFFVFWIPICIIGTLFIMGVTVIPRRVHLLYDYLLVANTASNPIVYGFYNQSFRSEYASIMGCRKFLANRIAFTVEELTGSVFKRHDQEVVNAKNDAENSISWFKNWCFWARDWVSYNVICPRSFQDSKTSVMSITSHLSRTDMDVSIASDGPGVKT